MADPRILTIVLNYKTAAMTLRAVAAKLRASLKASVYWSAVKVSLLGCAWLQSCCLF